MTIFGYSLNSAHAAYNATHYYSSDIIESNKARGKRANKQISLAK